MENTDPLPSKPTALGELADRFLEWVDSSRLEEMTKKFYRNGWRLLKTTVVADTRVDQVTGDCAERLNFTGSAANANCALRTLRRMLHKAEEWRMIGHAPKIKMMKEHGRHLRLDDDAEKRLLEGAEACTWRRRTCELFRDIIVLMRDTGMRNQRELYRMRIENLDWENRVLLKTYSHGIPRAGLKFGWTVVIDEQLASRAEQGIYVPGLGNLWAGDL
jgi:hypothetical protein